MLTVDHEYVDDIHDNDYDYYYYVYDDDARSYHNEDKWLVYWERYVHRQFRTHQIDELHLTWSKFQVVRSFITICNTGSQKRVEIRNQFLLRFDLFDEILLVAVERYLLPAKALQQGDLTSNQSRTLLYIGLVRIYESKQGSMIKGSPDLTLRDNYSDGRCKWRGRSAELRKISITELLKRF